MQFWAFKICTNFYIHLCKSSITQVTLYQTSKLLISDCICCFCLFCVLRGRVSAVSLQQKIERAKTRLVFLNPAFPYTRDDNTTDKPFFMFVLNIPRRGTSMTAYSRADLSRALSTADKSEAHSFIHSGFIPTRRSRHKTKHAINTNLLSIY